MTAPARPMAGAHGTAILLAVGLSVLSGCSGGGRVEIVSLNYRSIDPPDPRVARVDIPRCFWWTDAEGQLRIAMEREFGSPFGKWGRFQFQMSLVLERPPSGSARDYKVAERELRARVLMGPTQMRFTSVAGVVAVYRDSGDRLRGSFRLLARRVVSRWLGGWGRPSHYLMHGRFEAVHDERRGRDIGASTESAGWGRDPRRPASRPAATQPATGRASP